MKQRFRFRQDDVNNLIDVLGSPETIEDLFGIEFPDINGVFPSGVPIDLWDTYLATDGAGHCDFRMFRKDGKILRNRAFYFEINYDDSSMPFNARIIKL